jgi:probable phosphoglycerate mutase
MSLPETCLWLLRHGETEWSKSGQHTGTTDLPLTERGRQQAARLRPVMEPVTLAAVVTSPRQRAKDTCALAGCADRPGGLIPVVDEDLAEWDYGEYEGITTPQIREKNARWSLWTDGAPGGESPAQICARVDRLLAKWTKVRGDVAFFGHGHVLRVVALRFLGWPLEHGANLALDTATIGRLDLTPGQNEKRELRFWNRPA